VREEPNFATKEVLKFYDFFFYLGGKKRQWLKSKTKNQQYDTITTDIHRRYFVYFCSNIKTKQIIFSIKTGEGMISFVKCCKKTSFKVVTSLNINLF
jgi:hypothetical protein